MQDFSLGVNSNSVEALSETALCESNMIWSLCISSQTRSAVLRYDLSNVDDIDARSHE